MDAIEYLKEKKRMTEGCPSSFCGECPLASGNNGKGDYCGGFEQKYPEKAVDIVEQWSKEHPKKTYKSAFLEIFPNVKTTKEGHPNFCLKSICGKKESENIHCCDITCVECWNKEYNTENK